MLIPVTCPECGFRFKVEDRFSGQRGKCPGVDCHGTYVVPVANAPRDRVRAKPIPQAPQPRAERVAQDRATAPRPERVARDAALPAERVTSTGGGRIRAVPVEPVPRRSSPADAGSAPVSKARRASANAPTASAPARPQRSRRKQQTSTAPPSTGAAPRTAPAKPTSKNRRWILGGSAGLGLLLLLGATVFLRDGLPAANAEPANAESRDEAERIAAIAARDEKLSADFEHDVAPFLVKYCGDCHGDEDGEGGLDVTEYDGIASIRADREKFEGVVAMLGIRAMPPADSDPQPTNEERERALAWLDEALGVDCSLERDPGRVTIRRLNREEYSNTIRDLVGVDFDPAEDFPSDDVGYGFDNIGDVLSLPPLLLEKYVDAAERITAAAVDADAFAEFHETYADSDLRVDGRGGRAGGDGFYTLSSSGEVQATVDFPSAGEYEVRIEAAADQAGDEAAKMEFRVDGRAVRTFDVTGRREKKVYLAKVRVDKGRRRLGAAFVNDYYNPSAKDPNDRDRNLHVRSFEIRSTSGPDDEALSATHRRLVPVRPDEAVTVRDAAYRVLRPFARRAFRRPVDDEELEPYVGLVELVVENGDSFELGVQIAMQGVLVSPHFLFRIEGDPTAGAEHELDDWELATRLSYFLWSTMPDEELFRLAEAGTLHEPDVLEAQVRRMLADPRSRELVENFGGQWLNLGQLDGIRPDPKRFPNFDEELKRDMQRETLAFFEWVMRNDRSILDFLDARTTFLNERLARHYGVDGIRGEELREVSLVGVPRAGVLTQGSILLLTSNPTRTSPVKRGKWIMENVLGTPPPEAPPNVPSLEEAAEANPGASLREQLELHRRDPVCRSCHEQMDALGFGFETFDAIGRHRTKDDGHAIDASGVLPGGERFNGPIELIAVLKTQRELFARNLSSKMLTFALGRGLEYYDECAVDEITKNLSANDHRFSQLVLAIVRSDPFLKRRGAEKP